MATPEASSSARVSQAAKRPKKTEAFSKSLHLALSIFDDEVTTLSDIRETAYENFIVAYQTAFADIWPKIDGADIKIILTSVKDTELRQLRRMADMLSPPEEQPKLVEEQRNVPTSDAILGSLISRIPEQNPPSKQTCSLISDVFKDLAEAHQHYAAAAHNLSEVATLVSPEHLTIILAAAVQPNLQLVLPPGQVSPLFAPPTPKASSTSDRKELIQLCKTAILPDPSHSVFHKVEERTPTRVLAAAVYCTLEKHLFDETTTRNDVASKFRITAAQLHKAITGIDYKSGPHKYKKRRKIDDVSTSHTLEPRPSTSSKLQQTQQTKQPSEEPADPVDTLSSSSSESLYDLA